MALPKRQEFALSKNKTNSFIKIYVLFSLLVSAFGNLSCGNQKEAEFKPQSQINRPPIITSGSITPETPHGGSDLDVIIRSQDPDGDSVTYHYQWMKNNEEITGENKNILTSVNFKKGDLIQVKVTPSDSDANGELFLSDPVRILNFPPVLQEVRIEPKMAYANDRLTVYIKSDDIDGDSVYCAYQWTKNGEVLTEERAEVLEKGQFKKGDSIAVNVTPDDKESQGVSKKSEPITILNSPPMITSSPPTSVEGNDYIYQMQAYDPDNDPISFSLKSAPKGMEINEEIGMIRWNIQRNDKGTHPIEIEVSDQEGAKSFQRFVLNVEIR